VQDVLNHYQRILEPLIKKWNLTSKDPSQKEKSDATIVAAWASKQMKITITTTGNLEPSPVSDLEDERYAWLAGTLRGVFGEDVVVAPCLGVGMVFLSLHLLPFSSLTWAKRILTTQGNTDTRFYWKLSPQIYRINPYSSKWDDRELMIHTVDERMPVEGMVELVKFYHVFIRVVDEQRL
jgi:Gly-Xaa carboxypeptidase